MALLCNPGGYRVVNCGSNPVGGPTKTFSEPWAAAGFTVYFGKTRHRRQTKICMYLYKKYTSLRIWAVIWPGYFCLQEWRTLAYRAPSSPSTVQPGCPPRTETSPKSSLHCCERLSLAYCCERPSLAYCCERPRPTQNYPPSLGAKHDPMVFRSVTDCRPSLVWWEDDVPVLVVPHRPTLAVQNGTVRKR